MSTPPPKGSYATVVAIAIARIAFGYQVQTVASLAPDLARTFTLDFAAIGTLIGLYMAPGVFVALPVGFLARRFGDFSIAAIGTALMTVGAVLAAAADGPTLIGVGRAVSGCGAVALTVLQGKIIADRFDGARFTTLMGMMTGIFPVGLGIAQITQSRLADAFGWQSAFLAGGVISAVGVVLFVVTWKPLPNAAPRTLSFPSKRECGLVIIASLIWTFYNAAYFNFLAYMPSFLTVHGHSAATADVVMMLATWGNLPAILIGGALAIRFGPTKVFLAGTFFCALSVAGPAFWDAPVFWGAIFGTIASIHGGLIVQIGTLATRPENRAIGMAIFYTTYYIGGSAMPALCGRVADITGDPAGALLAAAILSLLAIPLYYWQRRAMGAPQ